MRAYTLSKDLIETRWVRNPINEDAIKATSEWIAVSDGAGGGGVFADKWSNYLVEHLPDEPIIDYQTFDAWIDGIWEPFYNEWEKRAKIVGGMLLNKFYDEGSFATLVAVWKNGQWISYGDSVAFCYDKKTGRLQHSFGRLVEFNNPPYLVNCKDPTDEKGFRCGQFEMNDDSVIFVASDAMAHFILMMYKVTHMGQFSEELKEALDAQTKDSNLIKTAILMRKRDKGNEWLKFLDCRHKGHFKQYIKKLYKDGLMRIDDYSLVIM